MLSWAALAVLVAGASAAEGVAPPEYRVCAEGAANLTNKDTGLGAFGWQDTSDPKVELWGERCNATSEECHFKICESNAVADTEHPAWHFCCAAPHNASVSMHVVDQDLLSGDDSLGWTRPLELETASTEPAWLTLFDSTTSSQLAGGSVLARVVQLTANASVRGIALQGVQPVANVSLLPVRDGNPFGCGDEDPFDGMGPFADCTSSAGGFSPGTLEYEATLGRGASQVLLAVQPAEEFQQLSLRRCTPATRRQRRRAQAGGAGWEAAANATVDAGHGGLLGSSQAPAAAQGEGGVCSFFGGSLTYSCSCSSAHALHALSGGNDEGEPWQGLPVSFQEADAETDAQAPPHTPPPPPQRNRRPWRVEAPPCLPNPRPRGSPRGCASTSMRLRARAPAARALRLASGTE